MSESDTVPICSERVTIGKAVRKKGTGRKGNYTAGSTRKT